LTVVLNRAIHTAVFRNLLQVLWVSPVSHWKSHTKYDRNKEV